MLVKKGRPGSSSLSGKKVRSSQKLLRERKGRSSGRPKGEAHPDSGEGDRKDCIFVAKKGTKSVREFTDQGSVRCGN